MSKLGQKYRHIPSGREFEVEKRNELSEGIRWGDWDMPIWLLEGSKDWEEMVELSVPVGTFFKHKSEDPTIYKIKSASDNLVSVEWDGGSIFTSYAIKKVNEYFSTGEWIQVEEKLYEILSFIQDKKSHTWGLDSQLKDTYCLVDGRHPHYNLSEMLNDETFNIHSVKRLSDGEVFTIGDRTTEGTIEEIALSVCNDGIYLNTEGYLGLPLKKWIKAKEPLFTTEDGIEIFEGDRYYYTYTLSGRQIIDNVVAREKVLDGYRPHPLGAAQFSAQELAYAYVEDLLPKYSKADMIKFANYAKSYVTPKKVEKAFERYVSKYINKK